ncbi:hypothetical protein Tco_0959040 [Tanacetum coccineum]
MVSPLAPRALDFSTPPSSPLELHPYLSPMHDLPQRSSNPLPQTLSQGLSQTLSQPTLIDFEPSFHPINLTRSRLSAQPEPHILGNKSNKNLINSTFFPEMSKKPSKMHNMCKIASFVPPLSPHNKCHLPSTSLPPPQLPYHHLDHHFHPPTPLWIEDPPR